MMILASHLLNNMGYVIAIAFILSKLKGFQKIMQKEAFNFNDKMVLSFIFSSIAILGTYVGVDYNGAIANTRNIGVTVAGILGGPIVGLVSGLLAGVHRFLIDTDGVTSIPCAISTILGGLIAGFLYRKSNIKNRYIYGFIGGIIIENLSMLLILIMSKPFYVATDIVKNIYVPMVFTNAIGISIVILITENIRNEKEKLAGIQSKLAMEIANKTLPYFREINTDSLKEVCKIISDSLGADLVVITDKENITGYYTKEKDLELTHNKILSEATKYVLKSGELMICDKKDDIINFVCSTEKYVKKIKSAIIAPLKEADDVIGTLKIYFSTEKQLTERNKYLAEGLSTLISTQMEISKIEKIKEMADKAEIRALQAQINPHFLFNVLHTITSFVRIDPIKAREIIIDLSTYLRHNLENGDKFVKLEKELEQVRAYVNIELARFGNKLIVEYAIDENINSIELPSLTIQPLVENAIKHGILESTTGNTVVIEVKKCDEGIKISVEDNGSGIDEKIIEKIYNHTIEGDKIGLLNVHHRLELIYNKGIKIENLNPGTKMSFIIND
ncbi:MAG: sensor histidine kinase [Fusobacteriaceae bacterium]|nr:sensor histidine kinase [Fusobacteriaceae bacterium]MBN2838889.1 sensor histidine kinase [Fusobacteriaceae bacterium]